MKRLTAFLGVEEARRLKLCRICRGKVTASWKNPFVYNYGREHAHERCLLKAHKLLNRE